MKPGSLFSRKLGLALFAAALVIGFAFVVARSGPLAPTQVTTVRVASGTVSPALFGIGTVEARRSYFIGPTAAGRVKAIHVDIGESVQAGQLLAEIEPVDLDERLRSSEAAQARAASAVVSAEAQRSDVLARLKVAELNAQRYRELGGKHFVSASAVESRQQELASAQAAVDASNANLQGARQEVMRLKAEQEGLRQQRNNLRLLAPHDGVVISRDAEAGSTVIAGQAVVKVARTDEKEVLIALPENRVGELAGADGVVVTLWALPDKVFRGRVREVSPQADPVTRTYAARVAILDADANVRLGMTARVLLDRHGQEIQTMIPAGSVFQKGREPAVWVIGADGHVHLRPVNVVTWREDGVTVRGGLAEGERIVAAGAHKLTEGEAVRVVDTHTAQP